MQSLTVFSSIFATLREYLDALGSLAEVDVYLAIFTIDLVLDAHMSTAEAETVLNAASLHPVLPTDLGTVLWFDFS